MVAPWQQHRRRIGFSWRLAVILWPMVCADASDEVGPRGLRRRSGPQTPRVLPDEVYSAEAALWVPAFEFERHLCGNEIRTADEGQIQSGRLRPLAVKAATRCRALPDVPTMAQAGVPGHEVLEWNYS